MGAMVVVVREGAVWVWVWMWVWVWVMVAAACGVTWRRKRARTRWERDLVRWYNTLHRRVFLWARPQITSSEAGGVKEEPEQGEETGKGDSTMISRIRASMYSLW